MEGAPLTGSARPGSEAAAFQKAARRFILLLMVVFCAKQAFSVAAFYPFSGHDELAHFSYVRTLALEGRMPVIPDLQEWRGNLSGGDPPPTDEIPADLYRYCRFTLDWFCDPGNPRWRDSPPRIVTVPGFGFYPSGYQYVANHPPLYYAVMAPIYKATMSFSMVDQHYLLRLAAIPFGLITVFAAFCTARTLFPGDSFLAVTVPALVAFQPQIGYEAAMVNNDIVAVAATSLLLWALVVGVRDRFSTRQSLLSGAVFGLGLLAKGTTAAMAPIVVLAVVIALGWRDWRGIVSRGVTMALPALLIAGPWYLYLYRTYGDLSGLGRVSELQYWNGPMGSFGELLTDPEFVVGRWRETWGEFGWRLIHLSDVLLIVIAIPAALGAIGLIVFTWSQWRGRSIWPKARFTQVRRWQAGALLLLLLSCIVAYLSVVQFGTSFALAQARYFFPVVNAAALLVMLGVKTLMPPRACVASQGVVVAALVGLNLLVFAAYVLPFTVTVEAPTLPWVWGG